MNPEIRWQSFERTRLPAALFGKRTSGHAVWHLPEALSEGRGIALGYAATSQEPEYDPPQLIVLEDHTAAEVLSWIRTYSPAAFPLNQFSRVILRSDWERLSEDQPRLNSQQRGDVWASMVLGELLAQGDGTWDPSTLPLSRYASCFSTAVARTAIIHSTSETSFEECLNRLARIEDSASFSQRAVSVYLLEPLWRVAYRFRDRHIDLRDVLRMVVEPILAGSSEVRQRGLIQAILEPAGDFFSDSVERRVLAFQRIRDQVVSIGAGAMQGNRVGEAALASIAVAAFLVGRGTSHAFLISRLGPRWAKSFVWFGLIAGLSGSDFWEQPWSLAAKGIEKFLRLRFDWCDPSAADISWVEYLWVSTLTSSGTPYAELPKFVPTALSVELLPGATCQLRLLSEGSGTSRPGAVEHAEADRISLELRDTLHQLANLAGRARDLIAPRDQGQMSLRLNDSDLESGKPPATRKRGRQ